MRSIAHGARLAKCLRLLTSDKDHEALAAVRALQRVLTDADTDIHDLADIIERHWPSPVIELRPRPSQQSFWWQTLTAELLRHAHDPRIVWGSRERDFLRSVHRLHSPPSPGQAKWLRDIAARRAAA